MADSAKTQKTGPGPASAGPGPTPADVLIIGGGPAGAAAATLLTQWGHSVVVLSRPSVVGDLAESLPPSCRKLFDRIGASEALDGAGFIRTTGNTVWWGGKEHVATFAPGERGYQVVRSRFDELLLHRVGGQTVLGTTSVTSEFVRRDGAYRVRCEAGGGVREIAARWVLDCSGRAGVVARRGWRAAPSRGRTLALVANWERAGGWGLTDETH